MKLDSDSSGKYMAELKQDDYTLDLLVDTFLLLGGLSNALLISDLTVSIGHVQDSREAAPTV